MRQSFIPASLRPTVGGPKVSQASDLIDNPDLLILAGSDDPTATYFAAFARQEGVRLATVFLDDPLIWPALTLVGDDLPLWLRAGGIYLRAPTEPTASTLAAVIADLLSLSPTRLISPFSPECLNASKPLQTAHYATRDGPEGTAVTQPLTHIRTAHTLNNLDATRHVVKSLSGVRSEVVLLSDPRLRTQGNVAQMPVQAQDYIEGRDIRVHVVDGRVSAVEIVSDSIDWRYGSAADIRAWRLPEAVANWCVAAAREEGLIFAGVDLVVRADENYVCLEINPMPGYDYFESLLVDQGEPAEISQWLLVYLLGESVPNVAPRGQLSPTRSISTLAGGSGGGASVTAPRMPPVGIRSGSASAVRWADS